MTATMYHATDATNKDSILEAGLQPQDGDRDRLVFLTTNREDAETVADVYPSIDDGVIFAVEVADRELMEDPEPHGDLDSRAHRGEIASENLTVVQG